MLRRFVLFALVVRLMGGDATEAQGNRQVPVVTPSTVDGTQLHAMMLLPDDLSLGGDRPLLVVLGGGQGRPEWKGSVLESISREVVSRGWIGVAVGGRAWDGRLNWTEDGEVVEACTYKWSMAYANSPDPAVGPGLQDVLDVIGHVKTEYPIDADRIYGWGMSLGGRGMYAVALQVPDLFAAIVVIHPATDQFDLDIRHYEAGRASGPCRMAVAGGKPGSGPRSATMRSLHSARFLIENAYHTPVFTGHTSNDRVAWNVTGSETSDFNHSFHLLLDPGWSGVYAFEGKTFDFGHTPTLKELQGRHPDGYRFAYMFSRYSDRPNGHVVDPRWITGCADDPSDEHLQGVAHPGKEGRLIGAFEYLESFRKERNPDTVVYKSYVNDVRKAFWVETEITTPWTNVPGAIRARKDAGNRTLEVEMVRVRRLGLDLSDFEVGPGETVGLSMRSLREPVFDPALKPGENDRLRPFVHLSGLPVSRVSGVRADWRETDWRVVDGSVEVGPLPIDGGTELEIAFGSSR